MSSLGDGLKSLKILEKIENKKSGQDQLERAGTGNSDGHVPSQPAFTGESDANNYSNQTEINMEIVPTTNANPTTITNSENDVGERLMT